MSSYNSVHTGQEIDNFDQRITTLENWRSNRNLLDNWYFVGGGSQQGSGYFPINQRGQTSYSKAGISIDRWRIDGNITINEAYISIVQPIYQIVLDSFIKLFLGKTLTASALMADGSLITGVCTLPNSLTNNFVHITYGNSGLEGYLRDNNNSQILRFSTGNYKAVKVELGSEQTLAHQENGVWVLNEIPDYGEELAECQRYYYPIPNECNISAVNRGSEHIMRLSIAQNFANTPRLVLNKCYVVGESGLSGPFDNPATSIYSRTDALATFNITNSGYQGVGWETVSVIFHNNSYITVEI